MSKARCLGKIVNLYCDKKRIHCYIYNVMVKLKK